MRLGDPSFSILTGITDPGHIPDWEKEHRMRPTTSCFQQLKKQLNKRQRLHLKTTKHCSNKLSHFSPSNNH